MNRQRSFILILGVALAAACGPLDPLDVGGNGNGTNGNGDNGNGGNGNGSSGNGNGDNGNGDNGTDGTWVYEVVDPVGPARFGFYDLPLRPVLGIASDGTAHTTYYNAGQETLVHSVRTSTGWTGTTIAAVQGEGSDGFAEIGHDFAVAPDGTLHVTFSDGEDAFYGRRDGATWAIEILGDSGLNAFGQTLPTRLALDAQDRPHVLFQGPSDDLFGPAVIDYARWLGTEWAFDDGPGAFPPAMAVDGGGLAHTAALGGSGTRVVHYRRSATTWTATQIASNGGGSTDYESVGLAVDDSDVPYVVFRRISTESAWLAHRTGDSFELVRVAENVPNVARVWIAVGPGGVVHLLVWNDMENRLQYLRRTGGGWTTPETIFEDVVWPPLSFVVGPDGEPAVAYYDLPEERMMFARRTQ